MAHDHAPDAEGVRGRLGGLVEKGARDVAGAVAEEEDGVGDDLLGVAGRVGDLQGQDHHEGGVIGPRQEVADVPAHVVAGVHEAQAERPRDVGAEEDEDEEAALVGEAVVQQDAGEDGEGDEGPVGDLHQGRDQRGEAEALDDQGAEVGYAAVGDVAYYPEEEEEVQFYVEEGFANLVGLKEGGKGGLDGDNFLWRKNEG